MKSTCYQKVLLVLFIAAISIQCKKAPVEKTELEKLPLITQNGANTFGCLINGKAFIPSYDFWRSTIRMEVEPRILNGHFLISAYRQEDNSDIVALAFGSDDCKTKGAYYFDEPRTFFSYGNPNCSFELMTPGTFRTGSFTITRYDLTQGIFSGTFDFTIYNNICGDTIHITHGRFDKLL